MPWECGECNAREDPKDRQTRIDAVCHHCGKPLCRDDQIWIADFVFAEGHGAIGREAAHCRSCRRRHHMTDLPLSWKS